MRRRAATYEAALIRALCDIATTWWSLQFKRGDTPRGAMGRASDRRAREVPRGEALSGAKTRTRG